MSIGTQPATRNAVEQLRRKIEMMIKGKVITTLPAEPDIIQVFTDLSDCPPDYVGDAGQFPGVTAAEAGLIFNPYMTVDPAGPTMTIRNMTDDPVDPAIRFSLGATPVVKFTIGVDDSDSDNAFRIDKGDTLGANLVLYSGNKNAIFGESACLNISVDDIENNVIVGYRAAQGTGNSDLGDGNVIIGADAALYTESGSYDNVVVGRDAIQYLCDASYGNVIVGAYTGAAASGGLHRSILLGYYANCGNDIDNIIVIGANASAGGVSNECVIGRRWDDIDPLPVNIRSGSPGGGEYKLDLWQAGTAKAINSLIRIVNPITAADMDGTGVGLLFGLLALSASSGEPDHYYDAAHIVAAAEADWSYADDGFGENSDIETIDSYLAFYTTLDGVLAEKVRISSEGKVTIESLKVAQGHPSNYKQVYVNTDTGELYRIA